MIRLRYRLLPQLYTAFYQHARAGLPVLRPLVLAYQSDPAAPGIDDEFLFVIACNTKFTGRGMKLAPRAEIGDGKIDVVLVRRASRLQMLKLFSRMYDGSHVSMDCVEYHQVRSLAIESEDCELLDLDGEMKGRAPFHAELLPAALRVFA